MKTIKFFVVAAFLAASLGANAQFTNTTGGGFSSSGSSESGWSDVWVEYNPISIKPEDGDAQSLTGFSAGFGHAFSLTQDAPILLEVGIGVQYASYSKKIAGEKAEMSIWSGKVPVNLLYNFPLNNTSISIAPFVGMQFRYNFSGPIKYAGESADLFEDADWKRFQLGWHIGAKVLYNQKFMAGFSYGSDLSEIVDGGKAQTTSIMIGFMF